MGKHKGNQFERELSKQLSLWWTSGERDDTMWHSHSSGGRATQRDSQTAYQQGDICPTHPDAFLLFDLTVIEAKRGYDWNFLNMLDAPDWMKAQILQQWVDKMEEDRRMAGVPYAMLIAKRDKRNPIISMPIEFVRNIDMEYGFDRSIWFDGLHLDHMAVRLDEFLDKVTPEEICTLAYKFS